MLQSLLIIPFITTILISSLDDKKTSLKNFKVIGLTSSIINLLISFIIFILFDYSTNQFQFVQEYLDMNYFDLFLGVDGLSIYFILLTTIIIPLSLLSNWKSITEDVVNYLIILLLLEILLLIVFLVLDVLQFYIFFESILPPLFILIGVYGSDDRVKASFYLFIYTLFGSLFLLLSILGMLSIISTTAFDTLFKGNFLLIIQQFLFYGIFIAFAVKTPTIFLNTWLLKAHVESPLGGSIILAAIVLKLSLYGILRLILPVLPKAFIWYMFIIFVIGVITIIYASLSTLRTIDVKELIAYSSVSHAAVYLLSSFSNSIQGIEGAINLGLAHGFVSPGLFVCAGGVLYDRVHTRLIAIYRGMAQIMPLFAILFFILCLANCGAPLSLNFVGEFLSLYGVFERSPLFGLFASSSIVFSAAYTMYMYQKISFGGSYSPMFTINIPDLNKREFMILLTLVVPTVLFGIYPAPILDGLHYSVSSLIYSFDSNILSCDAPNVWGIYFTSNNVLYCALFAILFLVLYFGLVYKYSKKNYSIKDIFLIFILFLNKYWPVASMTLFCFSVLCQAVAIVLWQMQIYSEAQEWLSFNIYQQGDLLGMGDNALLGYYPYGIDSTVSLSTQGSGSNDPSQYTGTGGTNPFAGTAGTGQPTGMGGTGQPTGMGGTGQHTGMGGTGQPTGMGGTGQHTGTGGTNPFAGMGVAYEPPGMGGIGQPTGEAAANIPNVGPSSGFYTGFNNTYQWNSNLNMNDGQVDHCDATNRNHEWNTANVHGLDPYPGYCYHCKHRITHTYWACNPCSRRLCGACNIRFDNHAFWTYSKSINDWLKSLNN